ncbi:response regulator [Marinisporobacter balticus]|uniref:Stage 0 sporulation protein A homolog n=1 Tax=Marinisporobacter balticus TaxID=2018667 RepID=A0A4R2KKG7_9FIRM|nr:response regulator [Marinisporobacter balticus]TCO73824.1 two-component system chemotaxis response regulator CheY [Marinisporobacter balticus]
MSRNDVFIVNDSKFESIVLKDILIKSGMNAIISDEHMIMKDLRNIKPAMVIVNYIMKDMTGDKVIEAIKKRFPEIICILASSSDLSKNQFIGYRIDEIIKIPVEPNHIKKMVEKYTSTQKRLCMHCKMEIEETFYICPYCGEKLKNRA